MQGHRVVVVGVGGRWGRELPGLVVDEKRGKDGRGDTEGRMKIAWRYERLVRGQSEDGVLARGGFSSSWLIANESGVWLVYGRDCNEMILCPDSVFLSRSIAAAACRRNERLSSSSKSFSLRLLPYLRSDQEAGASCRRRYLVPKGIVSS